MIVGLSDEILASMLNGFVDGFCIACIEGTSEGVLDGRIVFDINGP